MVSKKRGSSIEQAPEVRPYFTPAAFKFLRDLKRNNRREWFEARREIYEQELKQPMLALIEKVTQGMMEYAPGHIRPAQKSFFRIYRDTRFSPDKTPYKTHVAAWWTRSGLEKTSGGGYYLQVSPTDLVIAAGVFMPAKEQLFAIRSHLCEHHEEFGRLINEKKLRRAMNLHDPIALTRVPKGFVADHPASEWIRWRQWGVIVNLPAEEALKPSLAVIARKHFQLAQPLVDFLNAPLLKQAAPRKKPLFGLY
ncbi:uncharacterized protein (TIGR02453 family) [Silvibacterium bohemicum]|uniref:Uncharacterized protein (TIGR02453 family) n=1 Tax=Silvibacterium bohemicum TaxID=1577686 RepID=A0A841JYM7_9BACT|nr:DUF2461 domain-containing protein [Silvibacterium bohemicum]MBB6145517.1 uncharacterized protein (TIGR02453 family) [Silvibacterium bohemicum]